VTAAERAPQWPVARTAAMAAAFERAASDALRAPVLAERSVRLRRLAKAVIPPSARPVARRVVAHLDALSRRLVDLAVRR
jgi:hypothetical protein